MQLAVIAVPAGTGTAWVEQVRAVEGHGFHAVLVPDTVWTPSPFPSLAAAAAVTTGLRLRTWVLAAPLRSPAATAREASALQALSDGRFELGIGTGRPEAEEDAARLGLAWPAPAERIASLEQVVRRVRETVTPPPPVVVTASGPRMIAAAAALLAGPEAGPQDRLALALPPTARAAELAARTDDARRLAPGPIRFTYQVTGVGDRIPQWLARQSGLTVEALRESGSVGLLPGDASAAADILRAWEERLGIDEVAVPVDLLDDVVPILRQLHG